MTRRKLSWLIGGGVALLALLAVVTGVPLQAQAVESRPIDLQATSSSAEAPVCATMRLRGELESQRTVPIVNVFGLSQVDTTIVSPEVHTGGEVPCENGVELRQGVVVVYTPDCDNPSAVDDDERMDVAFSYRSLDAMVLGFRSPGM